MDLLSSQVTVHRHGVAPVAVRARVDRNSRTMWVLRPDIGVQPHDVIVDDRGVSWAVIATAEPTTPLTEGTVRVEVAQISQLSR